MRALIVAVVLSAAVAVQAADRYVYARDGVALCAPRELPSVGVRQDGGGTVLGLHGASDAVKAACGWYRVAASKQEVGTNQIVAARSYVIEAGSVVAQEVLELKERPPQREATLAARVAAIFRAPELRALEDDARLAAVISAVAHAVTGAVDRAVTVTIPAAKEPPGKGEP